MVGGGEVIVDAVVVVVVDDGDDGTVSMGSISLSELFFSLRCLLIFCVGGFSGEFCCFFSFRCWFLVLMAMGVSSVTTFSFVSFSGSGPASSASCCAAATGLCLGSGL